MAAFYDLLLTVHGEIWDAGTDPRTELEDVLVRLQRADLPSGVVRLPTSAMSPGPHLAAQNEVDVAGADVVRLETRRRARTGQTAWYAHS